MAVTGLPTCGTKATSESVTNIAHLALDMLGQLNNLDHENESMCEVSILIISREKVEVSYCFYYLIFPSWYYNRNVR